MSPFPERPQPLLRSRHRILVALAVTAVGIPSAAADTATLGASKDNTMYDINDQDQYNSDGAGAYFFAGMTDRAEARRALIAFDLSTIPAGSTITAVTLTLNMSRTRAGTVTVSLHRVLADWGEGTSNADGEEGRGAAPSPGDATWIHRFYNTTLWTTPGGQFDATVSASTSVGNNGSYSWSSAGMVADIQAWLDNPGSNFGWLVKGQETGQQTTKRFDSRQNTNTANRPRLAVTYTPPTLPTGACCFPDGTCQVLTQTNCTGQGGTYQGDNTDCTPNPCPQPTGACCLPGDVCISTTQAECTAQGGTYQGNNTPCTPNPCIVPTGACCLPNGTCEILTQTNCAGQAGTYLGDGTSCTPNPCGQQPITLTFNAQKDNILYESATGSLSNGAGVYLYVSDNNSNVSRRTVIKFDLSMIPPDATVTDADLILYCNQAQGAATNVTAHRLLADWGEGTSDANGDEANGAAATTGDATWLHRFYNTLFWTTPGGDFNVTPSATVSIADTIGFYTWTSAGTVTDVQSWVDNPAAHYGWLLLGYETASGRSKRFDSRQSPTAANWPKLTVTYLPSAVFGACCFLDGSCMELTQVDCAAQSGTYQGDGTTCVPNLCPLPTGACCFTDGSCLELTQADCTIQGGVFQGDFTDCTPNPCPQPTGACCFANGSCQELTQTDCTTQGGLYQGDGAACTPNPCPQPTGACCLASGYCVIATAVDCLAQDGTYQGDGTDCVSVTCPILLTPYLDPLPRPAVAQPTTGIPGGAAHYDIAMQEVTQQLHSQLPPTRVWGYGGSYPGPTIEARRGLPVTVTWINDLRDETGVLRATHYLPVDTCLHGPDMTGSVPVTVVHLHGGVVEPESDGYPEWTFPPGGQSPLYTYPNNQLAGTIWYHDHALGITRLNVYMGLAGFYLIRDDAEDALNLPRGDYEIAMAVQDRSFHPDGSLKYHEMWHDHFFGDFLVVNGKVWPYLNVNQGKYRFRIVNGSTSRVYTLSLSNGATFWQIGTDLGLLPAPVPLASVTLATGERADLVMDFAGLPAGTEVILQNSAPSPFPGTPGVGVIPNVMKFIVTNQPGHTDPLPATLVAVPPIPESEARRSRDFTLQKMFDPVCGHDMWMINDLHWDAITEFPRIGTTEIWNWVNRSGISHPMHLHLVAQQVLDRQDYDLLDGQVVPVGPRVPPPAHEAGWKDTVQAMPGQITRVIARFEGFTGLYPYHCHILEHEDHEMMRQFGVVTVGDADKDGDVDLADWVFFPDCMGGPQASPTPPPPGTAGECLDDFDAEFDGDVDLKDLADFQSRFTGG